MDGILVNFHSNNPESVWPGILQKTQQEAYYGRKDHLSPPVSSRGHSDSDISEFDVDERFARSVPGSLFNQMTFAIFQKLSKSENFFICLSCFMRLK